MKQSISKGHDVTTDSNVASENGNLTNNSKQSVIDNQRSFNSGVKFKRVSGKAVVGLETKQ